MARISLPLLIHLWLQMFRKKTKKTSLIKQYFIQVYIIQLIINTLYHEWHLSIYLLTVYLDITEKMESTCINRYKPSMKWNQYVYAKQRNSAQPLHLFFSLKSQSVLFLFDISSWFQTTLVLQQVALGLFIWQQRLMSYNLCWSHIFFARCTCRLQHMDTNYR